MITDNTAKWQVKSLNTPIANSGDGKLPVGHVYISMGSSAPAGSLPLWGQLFSRSTYKDLWEWVNLHPEQLLSESEWQTKYIENNGLVPFYSDGTDSTNFRLPNGVDLGVEVPKNKRVVWCVKAFGNIDEGTGSTSLDSIATNIAQLNTKVDGFASGLVDSHATAIAEMQSFFNGNYEKTLLAGGATSIGSGNIVLSDSWRNYDALLVFGTNDDTNGLFCPHILWKHDLENIFEVMGLDTTLTRFLITPSGNGQYYYIKKAGTTETTLVVDAQNGGIQAIYGIKLKATGITNKSAIDVSQMSEKISSLLTPDNHLRLPSGLEVW